MCPRRRIQQEATIKGINTTKAPTKIGIQSAGEQGIHVCEHRGLSKSHKCPDLSSELKHGLRDIGMQVQGAPGCCKPDLRNSSLDLSLYYLKKLGSNKQMQPVFAGEYSIVSCCRS